MNEVLQKIERIRSIFMETQLFYAKDNNLSALIGFLENAEPEFRSIAYESASMAIAVKDLENYGELNSWLYYAKVPALVHEAQVYVGLGWAIAKLNLPFLSVVEKIDSLYYYRVADGCGYYDGSFRQRQTVINQALPVYLPETAIPAYSRGVGRSLWYTNNADINKIRSKIDSFPASRHAGLWQGIGIAVAYAGGCDEDTLKTLFQYAAANSIQLAYGATLAARSRMEANTLTTDTDRCSRLWFSLTTIEANRLSSGSATIENDEIYIKWIAQVEELLANGFEKINFRSC